MCVSVCVRVRKRLRAYAPVCFYLCVFVCMRESVCVACNRRAESVNSGDNGGQRGLPMRAGC